MTSSTIGVGFIFEFWSGTAAGIVSIFMVFVFVLGFEVRALSFPP